jgi:hypothetical protein
MIALQTLPDHAPELDLCPLLRAAQITLQYAEEHGGIELTPTKAFKRVFVHWAVEHIHWPGMGYEELFRYNKVLNEHDFPPLQMAHFLITQLKLGRHHKGRLKVTRRGAPYTASRGALFGELMPLYVFGIDHGSYSRLGEQPVGNWDTWLNVINVEADHGADENHLFKTFYGYEASFAEGNWREAAVFSSCVLGPLEWAGFLDHEETKDADGLTQRHYVKTDLWRLALKLDTDSLLESATRH